MRICCICGKEVNTDDGLYINGRTAPICDDCGTLLNNLESFTKDDPQREKSYKLLQNKMQSNKSNIAVIEAVKEIYQQEEFIESESNSDQENDSDNSFLNTWEDESRFSFASGKDLPYVVIQVTLKEKFWGTGSGNLTDLEEVINAQVAKGYRLHTMSTSNGGSKGFAGGDRIQATLVFERLDMCR